MRILYLTDLHGVTTGLPELIAREAGADLCLLGGDLTSFRGPEAAERVLRPLANAFGQIRAVAGNTDRPEVSRWLATQGWSLDGRGEALDGLWLSGVEGSNHTPLKAPIELSEPELARRLAAGALPAGAPPTASSTHAANGAKGTDGQEAHPGNADEIQPRGNPARATPAPATLSSAPRPARGATSTAAAAQSAQPWILVTHVPPHQSRCDRIFAGQHVGSTAVRRFLETRRPRPSVHLCGHVHESVALDHVAGVTVCNPGAWTAARYAVITWDGDPAAPLQVTLRRMVLPPLLRWRARGRMMAEKVTGYARHRLGR
jgi:hypothetical protein